MGAVEAPVEQVVELSAEALKRKNLDTSQLDADRIALFIESLGPKSKEPIPVDGSPEELQAWVSSFNERQQTLGEPITMTTIAVMALIAWMHHRDPQTFPNLVRATGKAVGDILAGLRKVLDSEHAGKFLDVVGSSLKLTRGGLA